jgi:hypothetical protein
MPFATEGGGTPLPQQLVLPQVQLLQALRFRRCRWNAGMMNRISQLSVDFLIVKQDTSIVAAVELDDSSHHRQDLSTPILT